VVWAENCGTEARTGTVLEVVALWNALDGNGKESKRSSYMYLVSVWYAAGALGKNGSTTLRVASLMACRCGCAMSSQFQELR
jgi:hypothetical protein